MPLTSRARLAALLATAVLAAACAGDPTAPDRPANRATTITLTSDAQDYVGAGRSYSYTNANAEIAVDAGAGYFAIDITGDESWTGIFVLPAGMEHIQPGTYSGLQRYPFHDPAKGGMDWSGQSRGCSTITGSFTVSAVSYAGDSLTSIDLSFEQHCEGVSAALRGEIHWRAGDATQPSGPVRPIPLSLWNDAPPPTNGADFLYLVSDAGDYIGQGSTYLYTEPDTPITVQANAGRVTVGAAGWVGEFQAMDGLSRIEVGYYPGLQRYPFHNPAKGGLDFSGQGRGCNTLTGWFAVDKVTYTGDAITALDLRFEQHCEGGTATLHGKLHWTA
jgi:hypothetical protein